MKKPRLRTRSRGRKNMRVREVTEAKKEKDHLVCDG